MNHIDTMKQALEAFERVKEEFSIHQMDTAITALRKALAEQPAQQQEPVTRTDQQIVNQTEELAVWLLSWRFNHQPETKTPMRDSTHPFAQRCWAAACHIQEMLTATDPENAVAELDVGPDGDTSPPASKPLTDARIDEAIQQHVDPFATYRKLHDFARAIEAAHGIKES